jgi:peptidoglycan hydrolase-like protein with peptidoglycan-binding domain
VTPARPASSGIPTERVAEIQRALIKEGYLEGQASGQYDDATIAAMKQFQTDNGYPASGMPSAYTLKKLGVSKRTNDGYAVPINSATEDQKKPQQTAPQVKKGKNPGEANPQIE